MKRLFAVVDRKGDIIPMEGREYWDKKFLAKKWRDAQGKTKKGEPKAFIALGPDHDLKRDMTVVGNNKGLHPKHGKNQSQFGGKPRG